MLNDNAVQLGIDDSPSIPPNSADNNLNNDIDNKAKDVKPFMMHNSNQMLTQQQFPVGLEVENLVLDPKPNQFPNRPFYGQMIPPPQQYYPYMMNPNQPQQSLLGQQNGVFNNNNNLNSQFNPNEMIVPGIVVLAGDLPNLPQADQQNQQRAAQLGLLNMNGNEQIRITLMERIRKNAKWFAGCNACFTILLVISLLNKISLYSQKDTSNNGNTYHNSSNYTYGDSNSLTKASAVISVIEYIVWFLWIVAAIHGLTSNRLHLLGYFVKGIFGCACMEILANVLLFAGFGDWSAAAKVTFVIVFLLTLLIQYSFVKNARQLLRDIQQFKDKFGGNPLQVGNHNYHNNNVNLENNNLYMQNAQFQQQNPPFMNNVNLINNNNQNNRPFVYVIPNNNNNRNPPQL